MPKRKNPESEPVQFKNCVANAVPGYTICNLSEPDIRLLHEGHVPAWIHDTVAFWLRDHPKPSDVPPDYLTYEQEAAKLEQPA